MTVYNSQLAEAAQNSGVIKAIDFAIFQDHGYMGLYGGLKAQEIHTRKGLKRGQEILDYMGSDELAANIFRASQTKQKLEREQIEGKENATAFNSCSRKSRSDFSKRHSLRCLMSRNTLRNRTPPTSLTT